MRFYLSPEYVDRHSNPTVKCDSLSEARKHAEAFALEIGSAIRIVPEGAECLADTLLVSVPSK